MINRPQETVNAAPARSARTRARRGSSGAEAIEAGHLEIEGHHMAAEARRLEADVKHWEARLHEKKSRHGTERTGREHPRAVGRRRRPTEIEIDIIDAPEAPFDEAAEPIVEEVRLIAEEAAAVNRRGGSRHRKPARKGKKAPPK